MVYYTVFFTVAVTRSKRTRGQERVKNDIISSPRKNFALTMTVTSTIVSLLLLLSITTAFTSHSPWLQRSLSKCSTDNRRLLSTSPDIPPGDDDDYKGTIDWDAEWKKVVENKSQPKQRPGQGYYKSDAEIAVTKVVNKASQKAVDASKNFPRIRVNGDLSRDWRVWIGILVIISVLTSVLTAPPQVDTQSSYYI